VSRRGLAAVSQLAGTIGDTIAVTPAASSFADWERGLVYSGTATSSPRGLRTPAGAEVAFSYSRFEPLTRWAARFFSWSDSAVIRGDSAALAGLFGGTPILVRELPRLDFEWYRPPAQLPGLPRERWALQATAGFVLPQGAYRLRTISDDGIRVWLDGRLVIDRWSVHESMLDEVPLSGGAHDLRVEYFQGDGWTELRVELLLVRER